MRDRYPFLPRPSQVEDLGKPHVPAALPAPARLGAGLTIDTAAAAAADVPRPMVSPTSASVSARVTLIVQVSLFINIHKLQM
jgi:hypothetical protein